MKYASIKPHDIANGPGVRVSFFASGCHHRCPGCFNAEARDFNYGRDFTQETIDTVINALKPDYISGLTLLGGEPLAPDNQSEIRNLIRQVRAALPAKSIRCFSGFTYEFIEQYMVTRLPHTNDILSHIEVLVDGKRVEELKNLNLRFRGSANQRVIDVQRTKKTGQIVRAL
jgi:anaerobic ribonucleoside-triphosphate reductase activating protein